MNKTNNNLSICKTQNKFTTVFFIIGNLPLVVFTIVLVFLCNVSVAELEDYAIYAREQQEKAKSLVIPYQTEVNKIIENIKVRQAQPDIQKFKQEFKYIQTSKSTCPYALQQNQSFQNQQEDFKQSGIIVFVSFSMPKESIRGWIAQAQKINAGVYIRGLVNNSFKETALAINDLVKEQSGGLIIDPTLFKKYAITQVPAVVVVGENSGKGVENEFDIIYGDVSLDYALEKISTFAQGERKERLLRAIKILRGKSV